MGRGAQKSAQPINKLFVFSFYINQNLQRGYTFYCNPVIRKTRNVKPPMSLPCSTSCLGLNTGNLGILIMMIQFTGGEPSRGDVSTNGEKIGGVSTYFRR